jgi:exopolyphosphatase/guanosine-5'-triphosphate,3'-diphosphate pyrophosphatase
MLLAAVDLGSNSFRLEIGRVEGSHILTQGYWKETVRLAAGLDEEQRLTRKAMDTALDTLARMNERLRGLPASQVRAVGTQTLRVAGNAADFLRRAEKVLGYPIEVIAGREEARLVFEGCAHTLPLSTARRLVVDIGGASTELIVGRGFEAERAESFKVGCVNTSVRFFQDGIIDRASLKKAQVAVAAELEEAAELFSRRHWDEAYGSSGTAGAVSDILRAQGWSDGVITAEALLRLRHALLEAGEIRRIKLAGLKAERQEVIAGGVAVLSAVFDVLGVQEMRPARGALRVGVLYDLLGRREHRDVRSMAVERMQARFGVDAAQARAVAVIATQLHEALAPEADADARHRLDWAAALHEVGFAVSHGDYHKHGAYLVRHSDMAGFSTHEQERVALLVLGQRGNLRKLGDALAEPTRLAKILALRLAVILMHARRPVRLPEWSLRAREGRIEFALDGAWLSRHPLTQHLLEEEAATWQRAGVDLRLVAR